jgi:ligand-binding sensor domain-containing protein
LARSTNEILGGTLDGIIRSTDDGTTWSYADSGLTNKSIYSLVSSPDGKLFAGSNNGLFRTK